MGGSTIFEQKEGDLYLKVAELMEIWPQSVACCKLEPTC